MVPTQDPLLVVGVVDPLLAAVLGVVALAIALALALVAVPRRDAD